MLANQKSSLSSEQQLPKSRFTTNSMFQRQLSTNALNAVQRQQQAAAAASRHSPSSSAVAAAAAPAGSSASRLLARQMTASQLLGSSPHAGGAQATQHRPELASSASNLASSSSESASGTPLHVRPCGGLNERNEQQAGGEQKRPAAKNKRIISRMLSISAIHTTPPPPPPPPAASSTVAPLSPDRSQTAGDNLQTANEASPPPHTGPYMTTMTTTAAGDQVPDKIDSSFTRSRSSSCSSSAPNDIANQAAPESIQCLCFLDWTLASQAANSAPTAAAAGLNNKSLDSQASGQPAAGQLALWLGTSQGCVLLVSLTMPDSEDNRVLQLQSVQADPIPQAKIKLTGAILSLASFTSVCSPSSGNGQHLASQSSSQESELMAPTMPAHDSSTSSSSDQDRASSVFLAIVSEKQAKVFKVPTHQYPTTKSSVDHHHHHRDHHHHHHEKPKQQQPDLADSPMAKLLVDKANCFAKVQLSDTSHACCAGLVQMRQPDETCLANYLATGHITVHSLPQLRPFMEMEFVPYTSALVAQSMRFSRNGHALYQPSAGEVCKFTLSAQYKALLNDMTGSLYVPREMPEMPRTNFFKSLFSVATSSAASRQSDRDELFGESSAGKASRGVAKHISSGSQSSAMDKLKSAAVGSMGHEMRMAREGLDERGEKLGDIEDRTLQMMNQSENYAHAASQLAQKFKDKKWYQF